MDLEAGNELRLEVEKTDDGVGTVTGYVHRTETGEAVVSTADTSGHEPFEVPATGTYAVSLEIGGATASVVLRDMN